MTDTKTPANWSAILCALLVGLALGAACVGSAGALALAVRQEARSDVHERALGDVVRVINTAQQQQQRKPPQK